MGKIKIPKSRVQQKDKELERARNAKFTARLDDDLFDRYQNLRKDQQDEVLRQAYRYNFTPILGLAGRPTERPSFQARMRKVITDLENERVQPSAGRGAGISSGTKKGTTARPSTTNTNTGQRRQPVDTSIVNEALSDATQSRRAGASGRARMATSTPSKGASTRGLRDTPASAQQKATTHTIRKGETLGTIAKRYGVDWRALADANGIDDPNLIYAGVKLKIDPATMGKKNRRKVSISKPKATPPGMGLGEKKFPTPTREEALGNVTNMPMSTGALSIEVPKEY